VSFRECLEQLQASGTYTLEDITNKIPSQLEPVEVPPSHYLLMHALLDIPATLNLENAEHPQDGQEVGRLYLDYHPFSVVEGITATGQKASAKVEQATTFVIRYRPVA
jgi:hypothetical protein